LEDVCDISISTKMIVATGEGDSHRPADAIILVCRTGNCEGPVKRRSSAGASCANPDGRKSAKQSR
jgi:hypothetical protein